MSAEHITDKETLDQFKDKLLTNAMKHILAAMELQSRRIKNLEWNLLLLSVICWFVILLDIFK